MNLGPINTGPEWLETAFKQLSDRLKKEGTGMEFSVWSGGKDDIVPRDSQRKPQLTEC